MRTVSNPENQGINALFLELEMADLLLVRLYQSMASL